MARLVRLNEVQYVETEYDIERLLSEGFKVEELEEINNTDDPPTDDPPTDDDNQKGGNGKGSKKAEE